MTAVKVEVRLINDETGWTVVAETPERADGCYSIIPVPYWDEVHGGWGQILFSPSGERDAQGRPIFRTRVQ